MNLGRCRLAPLFQQVQIHLVVALESELLLSYLAVSVVAAVPLGSGTLSDHTPAMGTRGPFTWRSLYQNNDRLEASLNQVPWQTGIQDCLLMKEPVIL